MLGSNVAVIDLRFTTAFCCILIGMIFGIAVVYFIAYPLRLRPNTGTSEMSYADLAAILLTASSLILTAVGIGIALLAFYGARNIRRVANETAVKKIEEELNKEDSAFRAAVIKKLDEELDKEDGLIRKRVMERVDQIVITDRSRSEAADKDFWGDPKKEYGA